jgi:hypothetical protein
MTVLTRPSSILLELTGLDISFTQVMQNQEFEALYKMKCIIFKAFVFMGVKRRPSVSVALRKS